LLLLEHFLHGLDVEPLPGHFRRLLIDVENLQEALALTLGALNNLCLVALGFLNNTLGLTRASGTTLLR